MVTINLDTLADKAKDVDPDLRFMALEDFQKYVSDPSITKSYRQLEKFVPLLFKLLKDSATEVQNQAIKSFAPVVMYLSDDEVLNIIDRLYVDITVENSKSVDSSNFKKFTTSIPNMVLRSIFNSPNYQFSKSLSRKIVDSLLPKLVLQTVTIDSIEVSIDLVKNLGSHLLTGEIVTLITHAVQVSFNESGIISKRSIIALDLLLKIVSQLDGNNNEKTVITEKVITTINLHFNLVAPTHSWINLRYNLFQVILNNALRLKNEFLSSDSVRAIFDAILEFLSYDKLAEEEIDTEEMDYDLIVQENLIREDALITLIEFVNALPFESFSPYLDETVDVTKAFIHYNPFNFNDDEDGSFADNESDIEFSDDEDESSANEDDNENDGASGKLRIKSIQLVKSLIVNFPELLSLVYDQLINDLIKSLTEKNQLVSNEAIKTIITAINVTTNDSDDSVISAQRKRHNSDVSMMTDSSPYSELIHKVAPDLETDLFDNLLVEKNSSRFPIFITLIESLIRGISENLSENFLLKLFDNIEQFDMKANGNTEFLSLYKVILDSFEYSKIPELLLLHLLDDLSDSISDPTSYHNFIVDSLQICNTLFSMFDGKSTVLNNFLNEKLFDAIIGKINNKTYSSDLRQHSISSLTQMIINVGISEANSVRAIEVFQESLSYEVTVNNTIVNLIKLFSKPTSTVYKFMVHTQPFIDLLIEKLNSFIASSDNSLHLNSLVLLESVFKLDIKAYDIGQEKTAKLLGNLLKLIEETKDYQLITLSFSIMSDLLQYVDMDATFYSTFIVKVVNVKLVDVDDMDLRSYEKLVDRIADKWDGKELFEIGLATLNPNLFISAKTLSIITIKNGLLDKVVQSEQELLRHIEDQDFDKVDRAVFNIQFLGNVSSVLELSRIALNDFLRILNSSTNESIALAASRAIGLFISRDLQFHLPSLLENYELSNKEDDNKKNLLLIAIKQIIKDNDDIDDTLLEMIWNKINFVIDNKADKFNHNNLSELKLSGDILSKIIVQNENKYLPRLLNDLCDENSRDFKVYTNIVIIKQLISISQIDGRDIILKSLQYLSKLNIEIKQAIISTLLTGIHNRPEIFLPILNTEMLPKIFDELTAKEEFKKVIPMGPYKYIIDEGLEVRKLSYELLYTIILLENYEMETIKIDYVAIFENIVEKGIIDLENDIVVLSSINLIHLIEKLNGPTNGILFKIRDFGALITSLNKGLSKKIRAKASTQEVESFEDSIKSIVKLSKVINNNLVANNSVNKEWNQYYTEMKTNFLTFYNTVDV